MKPQKKYIELTIKNFEGEILDNEKACLVFFTKGNISKEIKYFDKLVNELNGALTIGVFNISSDDDVKDVKARYKLSNKFPQIRFYPNA